MAAVEVNGLKIEYESLGKPSDPPIVLIMGLGMQLVAWPEAFCQGLVERGFRVIRFDNRDCGLSGRIHLKKRPNLLLAFASAWLKLPVRAPYTLNEMADDPAIRARLEKAYMLPLKMSADAALAQLKEWEQAVHALDPEAVVTPGLFVQRIVKIARASTTAGGFKAAA